MTGQVYGVYNTLGATYGLPSCCLKSKKIVSIPQHLFDNERIFKTYSSSSGSFFLSNGGNIFCVGLFHFGQSGGYEHSREPSKISIDGFIVDFCCGFGFTILLR